MKFAMKPLLEIPADLNNVTRLLCEILESEKYCVLYAGGTVLQKDELVRDLVYGI